MNNFTFVIIDDNQKNRLKTKATAEGFPNLKFLAMADNYDDGIDVVLEYNPDIIFLEIDPLDKESKLSLAFINELYRYMTVVPKVFITTTTENHCRESFKYGVYDYFINPLETRELRKTLFRFDKEIPGKNRPQTAIKTVESIVKNASEENVSEEDVESLNDTAPNASIIENPIIELISIESQDVIEEYVQNQEIIQVKEESDITEEVLKNNDLEAKSVTFLQTENTKEKPLIICVKSYGDYRYIEAKDICYLQADNNSTDIHLNSGEMITAFKTLKHFEGVLSYPFVRIHNSYIVNIDYVSRIHTGNAVCHIKNTTTKLPFSKSYKENIEEIIATIASGNYLEI
ncbi:LytR/AlgR family response regulator transcription factor [Flavobacterium sp.]|uniref:LytR/AlgR family response regulator transcription factor n=1 Tax=Flavobacterium sp. TaxID=239 RepID=UPI003750F0D3